MSRRDCLPPYFFSRVESKKMSTAYYETKTILVYLMCLFVNLSQASIPSTNCWSQHNSARKLAVLLTHDNCFTAGRNAPDAPRTAAIGPDALGRTQATLRPALAVQAPSLRWRDRPCDGRWVAGITGVFQRVR